MTTITLQLPTKYDTLIQENDMLEAYLSSSLLDYVEMAQDMRLRNELNEDKEFVNLHDKLAQKLGNL